MLSSSAKNDGDNSSGGIKCHSMLPLPSWLPLCCRSKMTSRSLLLSQVKALARVLFITESILSLACLFLGKKLWCYNWETVQWSGRGWVVVCAWLSCWTRRVWSLKHKHGRGSWFHPLECFSALLSQRMEHFQAGNSMTRAFCSFLSAFSLSFFLSSIS